MYIHIYTYYTYIYTYIYPARRCSERQRAHGVTQRERAELARAVRHARVYSVPAHGLCDARVAAPKVVQLYPLRHGGG